mmetsp:Transcript_13072/g.15088  ORF Transcript_13072/g.15088 Transcript_13072/m.15088 type:complete len:334 (+) Transcript_13072:478-1479(+)
MARMDGRTVFEWTNETGVIDMFLFNTEDYECNSKVMVELSGKPPLPLETSLGYNQCRWNYHTQEELLEVNALLTEHKIPTDFLWLDIEYSDSKMYFTFDKKAFPEPEQMLNALVESDRQLVTIVDPHCKHTAPVKADTSEDAQVNEIDASNKTEEAPNNKSSEQIEKSVEEVEPEKVHYLTTEAIEKELVVRNKDEELFVGDCWPGASVYIDFFNHRAQEFFGSQYLKKEHIQSNPHVHIWNDMNEPAVFVNQFEKTMPKNSIHVVSHYVSTESSDLIVDNFEHRDVHNLYGILMAKSSYEGLIKRDICLNGETRKLRSFLLSRSFYFGSQKF